MWRTESSTKSASAGDQPREGSLVRSGDAVGSMPWGAASGFPAMRRCKWVATLSVFVAPPSSGPQSVLGPHRQPCRCSRRVVTPGVIVVMHWFQKWQPFERSRRLLVGDSGWKLILTCCGLALLLFRCWLGRVTSVTWVGVLVLRVSYMDWRFQDEDLRVSG